MINSRISIIIVWRQEFFEPFHIVRLSLLGQTSHGTGIVLIKHVLQEWTRETRFAEAKWKGKQERRQCESSKRNLKSVQTEKAKQIERGKGHTTDSKSGEFRRKVEKRIAERLSSGIYLFDEFDCVRHSQRHVYKTRIKRMNRKRYNKTACQVENKEKQSLPQPPE